MENFEDEELLKRYLLGEVTQEQMEVIQDRLLLDTHFLNQLLIIENEMIEDCASDNLPLSQVEMFEKHFLRSPERRRRLKVARQLKSHAARSKTAPVSVARPHFFWPWKALSPQFLRAAAMLVMVAALLWLLYDRGLLKAQLHNLEADQDQQQQQQEHLHEAMQHLVDAQGESLALQQQLRYQQQRAEQMEGRIRSLEKELSENRQLLARQREDATGRTPSLAALPAQPLWSGQGRGPGQSNVVRIGAGDPWVRLELVLDQGQPRRYRVMVNNADSQPLLSLNRLKPRRTANGSGLVFNVPARLLPAGDYFITVQGAPAAGRHEHVDAYQFRVQIE